MKQLKLKNLRKDTKVAVLLVFFLFLVLFMRANAILSFTKIFLELRTIDGAFTIIYKDGKSEYKTSLNEASCDFSPAKRFSYSGSMKLAFVMSDDLNFEKSVHTKENPMEYYLKIEKGSEIHEYYYTPDKLPRNLAIISGIMLSPWQKELKKYNFQT
ncbi:hypothetical protein CO123_00775 [bacterium (Candidatus Howlettbacteria) CG_4_9_14_3_um_filter_37_10]|nr:MAG: hypothetical protein CO123_00775 [bacterium (Candidatus Howlettbacteria) CG_4_9_14_3_um_filter_37_10]